MARSSILLLSPIPPPMHGAAYAADLLLHSRFAALFSVVHINARFVEHIHELQSFTPKKALLVLKYWWQLLKAIAIERVGAVILTPAFYPKPFLKDALYIWTARLLGQKVVAWYHMNFVAMEYDTLPTPMQWFIKKTLLAVDCHVCVGERLTENLPAFINRANVAVVRNGIPPIACANPPRPREGRQRIVYLSNLGTAKGWRVLFGVAERLCEQYPQAEVVFYGNPMADSPQDEIERTFAESKFPTRIVYGGAAYGERKAQALCSADIFCFPSLNEAFPLTVLEAMSAGAAIVASDVGAVREAVEHGKGGILVPPGDADALERALQTLLDEPERRVAMGALNKQRFEQEFTVQAFAQRWGALIERVVAE